MPKIVSKEPNCWQSTWPQLEMESMQTMLAYFTQNDLQFRPDLDLNVLSKKS